MGGLDAGLDAVALEVPRRVGPDDAPGQALAVGPGDGRVHQRLEGAVVLQRVGTGAQALQVREPRLHGAYVGGRAIHRRHYLPPERRSWRIMKRMRAMPVTSS